MEFKLLQQSTIPPPLDSDCLKPTVFNTSRFITGYSSLQTSRTEHIPKAYIPYYVPWIINETKVTLRLECVCYRLYHNYWLHNLHAVTKLRLFNLSFIEKFQVENSCIMKPSKRAQISSVCHTSRLSTPVIIRKDFIMQMREQTVQRHPNRRHIV